MPRSHRPAVAIQAELRSLERRSRVGAAIKAARLRRHWTQAELGRRASLGRMVVARIERGKTRLDVEALERLALALGLPLTVELGRDPHRDVADAGHLAMQELVLRTARRCGLERRFELATRPNEPWRSADVCLASKAQRTVIDVECWNTFGDVGAGARSSDRKRAELAQLAVATWGAGARAAVVWVVRDTAANRALIARFPEVFAARFTGSSREWVEALTSAGPIPERAGLVWCDRAATRLWAWRRPA
jgi:transcriptional regulator with XRE-family HTH domain